MDLQTFIRETLVEIVGGVHDAQAEAQRFGAIINPKIAEELDPAKRLPVNFFQQSKDVVARANLIETAFGVADMVEFDIALTVSESSSESGEKEGGGKATAKLLVASLEIGGSGKTTEHLERSGSSVSRIKFRIPVSFPQR